MKTAVFLPRIYTMVGIYKLGIRLDRDSESYGQQQLFGGLDQHLKCVKVGFQTYEERNEPVEQL